MVTRNVFRMLLLLEGFGLGSMLVLVQCWIVDCCFVRSSVDANGKTGGSEQNSRIPATSAKRYISHLETKPVLSEERTVYVTSSFCWVTSGSQPTTTEVTAPVNVARPGVI